jgi:hypothetical protein
MTKGDFSRTRNAYRDLDDSLLSFPHPLNLFLTDLDLIVQGFPGFKKALVRKVARTLPDKGFKLCR